MERVEFRGHCARVRLARAYWKGRLSSEAWASAMQEGAEQSDYGDMDYVLEVAADSLEEGGLGWNERAAHRLPFPFRTTLGCAFSTR
ncbi:hypothetical protein J2852_004802 [Azospirillum soli]|nr:hypothetical protein [Azospirillum soli]